jgi:hypothetical protein
MTVQSQKNYEKSAHSFLWALILIASYKPAAYFSPSFHSM